MWEIISDLRSTAPVVNRLGPFETLYMGSILWFYRLAAASKAAGVLTTPARTLLDWFDDNVDMSTWQIPSPLIPAF
jgi:hypothetical protein